LNSRLTLPPTLSTIMSERCTYYLNSRYSFSFDLPFAIFFMRISALVIYFYHLLQKSLCRQNNFSGGA
ncbi:hypothetical protein, partial [Erwinia sp. V71]|uniref:hypothetical protein n=1 Tax=Erwinia sp. V71 TaxID=3369424 RepID=UPI003F60E8C3